MAVKKTAKTGNGKGKASASKSRSSSTKKSAATTVGGRNYTIKGPKY